MDDGAIIIVAAKSSPEIQAHINRVIVAEVAISDDTGSADAVLGDGDGLAAELVVLGGAVLVEDASRHGNERRVGVDVLEVGADAASTVLAQDAVALVGIAEAVDGAVGVVLVDVAATRGRRVRAAAAVVGTGSAVTVLRTALAGSARSSGVAAVARRRGRAGAAAVVGASTTVAVLGAALARGAVGAARAFAGAGKKRVGRGHSHDRGGQREAEEGKGLLHVGRVCWARAWDVRGCEAMTQELSVNERTRELLYIYWKYCFDS